MTDEPLAAASPGFLQPEKPWADRNGFSHAALAIGWIIVAFILFQVLASIIAFVLIALRHPGEITMGNIAQMVNQNLNLVFVGNSIGQILFLALGTWVFCRLQVSKANRKSFLRLKFRNNTFSMIIIVIFLILSVQPVVWFLGWLNSFVPSPQALQSLQAKQMGMIQTYLTGDGVVWIALFNIGLVPAFCEELLFRGYVLRSFQKSWGITAAIIVSGILFGMFHVQLTNLIPLAGIGMLLGYIAWTTQSIFPAMVAHFVNNGTSVLVAKYYPNSAFADVTASSAPPITLVLASVVISAYLLYLLFNNRVKPTTINQGVSHV